MCRSGWQKLVFSMNQNKAAGQRWSKQNVWKKHWQKSCPEVCPIDKGSSWNKTAVGHEMESEKPEDAPECELIKNKTTFLLLNTQELLHTFYNTEKIKLSSSPNTFNFRLRSSTKNLSSNTYLHDFIWLPYDPKKLCYSNLNWLTPLHTKAMRCYRPLDHGSGWRSWPVWAGCADQHFAGRTLPFHVGSKQLKQNHNEFALGHCNCFSGSSASDFA